jgi:DNA-binding NtrC family response regulator
VSLRDSAGAVEPRACIERTREDPRAVISDRLEKLVEEMVDKGVHFDDAIREFEKRFIARVLGHCSGSLTKTADKLGIHRNTLTRKMEEYKIKKRAGGAG